MARWPPPAGGNAAGKGRKTADKLQDCASRAASRFTFGSLLVDETHDFLGNVTWLSENALRKQWLASKAVFAKNSPHTHRQQQHRFRHFCLRDLCRSLRWMSNYVTLFANIPHIVHIILVVATTAKFILLSLVTVHPIRIMGSAGTTCG